MKTTLRIAKLELSTLFYSPIAWFLSVVFLFQSGLTYTNSIQNFLISQNIGGESLQYLKFITVLTFGPYYGTFAIIVSKIYLYLPLLTMGLISREVSSGTIKLLYSSPIKLKQIVLGKFLAMMAYSLLLAGILGIFVIAAVFNIKSADVGLLISGLFGVFLLLCAYSAIGLFMSCLTAYQIVAAISTLVVFAALDYIGQIWQDIDFVRDLTYFLSISGRTNHILFGIIDTKDVLYFVIITCMFLAFSVIKLQAGRAARSFFATAGQYVLVFVSALALGYLTSRPALIAYLDATADKTQTITPNTRQVMKQIGDEPLEVTSYINLLDQRYWYGKPDQRNNDLDRWARYLRFKPNIQLKYVYYYALPMGNNNNLLKFYPGKTLKQVAEQFATSYKHDFGAFKSGGELEKTIDLQAEQNRYVMQLKFRGKSTFLRLFDDPLIFPNEQETTAALKRLTVKLPKIAFLEGEFERSIDKLGPRDFGSIAKNITFRYALINQGFDVESVSLKDQEIPGDIAALVIGDPRAAFAPQVLAKIQKYVSGGGNLLIAGEPDKKGVLSPILQPLGVQMTDGLLLQTSKDYSLNMVAALLTPAAANFSGDLKKAFADSLGVVMPGAAGLTYNTGGPYKITPLLMTDARNTWNKKGRVALDSAAVGYSAANGDDHKSMPALLALTRKVNGKEQRIIVAGDADFLTTAALSRDLNTNFIFNTQLFRWFTYGQFPIDASRPEPKDDRVRVTNAGMTMLKVLFLGVLPGLVLLFGGVFLVRRKRK